MTIKANGFDPEDEREAPESDPNYEPLRAIRPCPRCGLAGGQGFCSSCHGREA